MPVMYTNRKGVTYYLCRGKTASGKPRYYFTPRNEGDLVEQIPVGYIIRENVNGQVSLARVRAPLIQPEELALVQAALRQHRRADNYRVQVKVKQIEVYERASADPEVTMDFLKQDALMGLRLWLDPKMHDRAREVLDRGAQFTPFLRFVLQDPDRRLFGVKRRRYSGRGDEWITLSLTGTIEQLTPQIIPKLDTDAFFEIF